MNFVKQIFLRFFAKYQNSAKMCIWNILQFYTNSFQEVHICRLQPPMRMERRGRRLWFMNWNAGKFIFYFCARFAPYSKYFKKSYGSLFNLQFCTNRWECFWDSVIWSCGGSWFYGCARRVAQFASFQSFDDCSQSFASILQNYDWWNLFTSCRTLEKW